ncbi:glutamyl-tRNA(Gln) amidotransferase subunit B, mitochondrial isoform X2 [Polyodon spathula]|uniref:glutamyl-tRNA(Gln) amidotransferase subunit B, mitochondrial isoform X2 n=1 Tax=Polyodon spathula TaxID=7913 RepID=UPI001B7F365D|nr:glutamyl-tRNA(Gln) amidotransferase subunit B, mitochondrial isoform X2 [Polyodon spathula]
MADRAENQPNPKTPTENGTETPERISFSAKPTLEDIQWKGEVAEGLPDWSEQERVALSHELSDVLIYLVELAEKCHVDLPQAVLEKMQLNRVKYPASKVHGSAKKYTEYQD